MPYAWSLVFLFVGLFLQVPLWSTSKKGHEYLTWDTARVFIPFIRFLLESFVSCSFLVLLRYSFFIFSFIFTCLMVSVSKMPKYLKVSLSPSVLMLSWFGSGQGSDDNVGVLCIPQSWSITGTSPSDCLVLYLGHSLGEVLPLCREAVGIFYSPSQLGKERSEKKKFTST